MKQCEGSCKKHIGDVEEVHVIFKNKYDWGTFCYCQEAIAEDRRRGFTVTRLGQEDDHEQV